VTTHADNPRPRNAWHFRVGVAEWADHTLETSRGGSDNRRPKRLAAVLQQWAEEHLVASRTISVEWPGTRAGSNPPRWNAMLKLFLGGRDEPSATSHDLWKDDHPGDGSRRSGSAENW